MGRRYTDDECKFIVNNYKVKSLKWIAKELGRSTGCICEKARVLGLTENNPYTSGEDSFIRANYPVHGSKWCAKELGRTYNSVKGRISNHLKLVSKQGQGKKIKWSDNDIEKLKLVYPKYGPTETAKILSRSVPSVRAKAIEYDLHRDQWKWSGEELNYLVENCRCYRHINEIAKVLGRTPDAVYLKARQLQLGYTGYIQPSRLPLPSGLSVEVYRKYSGKCKICDKASTETMMEIHHIIPYRIVKCHELDNLMLLCVDCHLDLHHQNSIIINRGRRSPLLSNKQFALGEFGGGPS